MPRIDVERQIRMDNTKDKLLWDGGRGGDLHTGILPSLNCDRGGGGDSTTDHAMNKVTVMIKGLEKRHSRKSLTIL